MRSQLDRLHSDDDIPQRRSTASLSFHSRVPVQRVKLRGRETRESRRFNRDSFAGALVRHCEASGKKETAAAKGGTLSVFLSPFVRVRNYGRFAITPSQAELIPRKRPRFGNVLADALVFTPTLSTASLAVLRGPRAQLCPSLNVLRGPCGPASISGALMVFSVLRCYLRGWTASLTFFFFFSRPSRTPETRPISFTLSVRGIRSVHRFGVDRNVFTSK